VHYTRRYIVEQALLFILFIALSPIGSWMCLRLYKCLSFNAVLCS